MPIPWDTITCWTITLHHGQRVRAQWAQCGKHQANIHHGVPCWRMEQPGVLVPPPALAVLRSGMALLPGFPAPVPRAERPAVRAYGLAAVGVTLQRVLAGSHRP